MKPGTKRIDPPKAAPTRFGLIRLFSICALGLSVFLLWGSLSGEKLPGCGLESGCGTVLHSRWSKFLGVPVSLPALLLYSMVLVSTLLLPRATDAKRQQYWAFLIAAAAALIGAAIWFIGLQLFVIKAICPFCMTAHTCGLIVGILLFLRAPRDKSAPYSPAFAIAGFAGVAILAAGQIAYQPKTFDVLPLAAEAPRDTQLATNPPSPARANIDSPSNLVAIKPAPISSNLASAAIAQPPAPLSNPKARRSIDLHGGVFSLELSEAPLMGSPDAPFVIVHLFDYSCQHCRQLHPILTRAVRDLSNQLAIICLPVPLATNCNRLIKRPIPDHVNACYYAYDGLALWRANPAKMREFDDWVFGPPRPPTPDQARAEAVRLAGGDSFTNALNDPWLKQQLDINIRIFETNFMRYRRSQLPQLMIGTNIVTGVLRSTDDLYRLLSAQFPLMQLPAGAALQPTNTPVRTPEN